MNRVFKFSIFYLVVSILLHYLFTFFVPLNYYWGSDQFVQHINTFNKLEDVNSVFFGSSHVASHIIPSKFDSISSERCKPTKSYNFGIPGSGNPEYYYLYQNLLRDNNSIKYAFFEVMEIKVFDFDVLKMNRTNYWMDVRTLFATISILKSDGYPIKTKTYRIGSHIYSYAYQVLSLSKLFFYFSNNERKFDKTLIDGYKPLPNWDENISKESASKRFKTLSELSLKEYEKTNNQNAYVDQLKTIIDFSKNKDVEVFFIIGPRGNDYTLGNLIKRHFPKRTIDLSNSSKYPDFYTINNSFDLGHFNQRGAKIYTKCLAEAFFDKTCPN